MVIGGLGLREIYMEGDCNFTTIYERRDSAAGQDSQSGSIVFSADQFSREIISMLEMVSSGLTATGRMTASPIGIEKAATNATLPYHRP